MKGQAVTKVMKLPLDLPKTPMKTLSNVSKVNEILMNVCKVHGAEEGPGYH